MPKLEFERTFDYSAHRVLIALSRIDQHQNFIPGCKQSTIESCKQTTPQIWEGLITYVVEFKKYGVYEEVRIRFFLDAGKSKLRLEIWDREDKNKGADIEYILSDLPTDKTNVELKIDYKITGKKFFWVAVKPLARRFFHKFMDLIEQQIAQQGPNVQFSFEASSDSDQPAHAVRGFRQLDHHSFDARMQVLQQLPINSVGAEIGTYMGAFAQLIIDTIHPQKLYLIDPWIATESESQAGSWYETVDQDYMDNIFGMVSERFSDDKVAGKIEIVRDYSTNAMSSFADLALDWVYIDGDHSYEAVRNDLHLSFAKVRKGGFIAGDDYLVVDKWWKDSVVRAVTEFVNTHPVEFVLEEGSQFLLRKE